MVVEDSAMRHPATDMSNVATKAAGATMGATAGGTATESESSSVSDSGDSELDESDNAAGDPTAPVDGVGAAARRFFRPLRDPRAVA